MRRLKRHSSGDGWLQLVARSGTKLPVVLPCLTSVSNTCRPTSRVGFAALVAPSVLRDAGGSLRATVRAPLVPVLGPAFGWLDDEAAHPAVAVTVQTARTPSTFVKVRRIVPTFPFVS